MSGLTLFKTISITSSTISVIVAVLPLFWWKRFNATQRWLGALLIFSAIVEVFAFSLAKFKINNLPLLHLYTIVEFFFLIQIFSKHLSSLNKTKNIVLIFFIGVAVFNSFSGKGLLDFNHIARSTESFLIILFCIWYFYDILNNLPDEFLEKNPMFWINTGLLIYFSASLFIFIFSNYLLTADENLSLQSWNVHGILTIIHNLFYLIAISVKHER